MSKDVLQELERQARHFEGVASWGTIHEPVIFEPPLQLRVNWEKLENGPERRHSLGEIITVTQFEDALFSLRYGTLQSARLIAATADGRWDRVSLTRSELMGSNVDRVF